MVMGSSVKNLHVFNSVIYSNCKKFDAHEIHMFYSNRIVHLVAADVEK